MYDINNDMEELSRSAANKLHVAFDEDAWTKMEALLDKEDDDTLLPPFRLNEISKTKFNRKIGKWGLLFLLLSLGIGSSIWYSNNKLTNKIDTNKRIADSNNSNEINKANLIPKENEYDANALNTETSSKLKSYNKQLVSKSSDAFVLSSNIKRTNAIANSNNVLKSSGNELTDKKYTKGNDNDVRSNNNSIRTVTINRAAFTILDKKRNNKTKTKLSNDFTEIVKDDKSVKNKTSLMVENDLVNTDDLHNDQQIINTDVNDSIKEMNKRITITKLLYDTNKLHRTASIKKIKRKHNCFLKNIGLVGFAAPELNTVKFKHESVVNASYGAGIKYAITKHLALSMQYIHSWKKYGTDKQGYIPPAGSIFWQIDTLHVDAQCKVYDVPINITYSFSDNTKNNYYISGGISSYFMKKEIYDFQYYEQGVFKTRYREFENRNNHRFSTLNISGGCEKWISKKWALNTEVYTKLPIKGVGIGKVNITSIGVLVGLSYHPWK